MTTAKESEVNTHNKPLVIVGDGEPLRPMRFLAMHVDYFRSEITQKGRSSLVEPYDSKSHVLEDGLLVLVSVEKGDEANSEGVATRAADELADIARKVGARRIVLHSFAHLFAVLAAPTDAVPILDATKDRLIETGLETSRTPFGWFNTLEIRAKGHPLSRVARVIQP